PEPSSTARDLSASSDACFSVQTIDGSPSYALWSHDPTARLLSKVATDEHGTPETASNPAAVVYYWKMDAAGHVVLDAHTTAGGTLFRTDIQHDEHGNAVLQRVAYNAPFDLTHAGGGFV